ncbi:MAG TPA: hypothetical protein VFE30_09565 [Anaeromyxobacteraceae bacterium]|nr:hypothetical protein [Anaeromyxobacteraceae bacterium]
MKGPAAAFALVVGALGVQGLWFEATLPGRLPSERDWLDAAAVVEREARPGDAVALAPWWAERGRLFLPERVPALALPGYAGEALPGIRRVFLLELPRAPRWDGREAGELRARSDAAGPARRFGALGLTLLTLRAPLLPRAFLPDLLRGAEVTLGGRPCPAVEGSPSSTTRAASAAGEATPEGLTARAFRCPGPAWLCVAAETREVDLRPRDCIYAHPAAGAPLRIRFPAVPLGTVLRGHTGIIGEAALRGAAPVRLTATAGGEYLGAVEEPPRTPGWHPFAFDTRRLAGRTAEVAFTVTSPDPSSRWFCFDAMTVDEPLVAPERERVGEGVTR